MRLPRVCQYMSRGVAQNIPNVIKLITLKHFIHFQRQSHITATLWAYFILRLIQTFFSFCLNNELHNYNVNFNIFEYKDLVVKASEITWALLNCKNDPKVYWTFANVCLLYISLEPSMQRGEEQKRRRAGSDVYELTWKKQMRKCENGVREPQRTSCPIISWLSSAPVFMRKSC